MAPCPCYAELYDALQSNEALLFGAERGENRRTHNDRRILVPYCMVDWMLSRGAQPFTLAQALAAADKMSSKITLPTDLGSVLLTTI